MDYPQIIFDNIDNINREISVYNLSHESITRPTIFGFKTTITIRPRTIFTGEAMQAVTNAIADAQGQMTVIAEYNRATKTAIPVILATILYEF